MKANIRNIQTVFLLRQQSTIEDPPSLYNLAQEEARKKMGEKEEMVKKEVNEDKVVEQEKEAVKELELEMAPLCGHNYQDVLDTSTVKDLHLQMSSDIV